MRVPVAVAVLVAVLVTHCARHPRWDSNLPEANAAARVARCSYEAPKPPKEIDFRGGPRLV